eukprot:GHRQ01040234.1.p1 GENE.GHRQ01040234.1~~GHRQ01040234.1.p1  ORF type:complete len:217 (-),score=1.82 GHRQ01040234.1:354-1004(-)
MCVEAARLDSRSQHYCEWCMYTAVLFASLRDSSPAAVESACTSGAIHGSPDPRHCCMLLQVLHRSWGTLAGTAATCGSSSSAPAIVTMPTFPCRRLHYHHNHHLFNVCAHQHFRCGSCLPSDSGCVYASGCASVVTNVLSSLPASACTATDAPQHALPPYCECSNALYFNPALLPPTLQRQPLQSDTASVLPYLGLSHHHLVAWRFLQAQPPLALA